MNDLLWHENLRKGFGIFDESVFLNFAGVAPVCEPVRNAVSRWADMGSKGDFDYNDIIESAGELYERLTGGHRGGFFFTRNTTHGIHTFILGYPWRTGDSVVIADCEFPANRLPWLGLDKKGVNVKVLKSWDYKIDPDEFIGLCDRTTKVISISHVQYLSGQRIDISRLGEFCKERGILLVVDAIQGLGVIPMNVIDYGIDWLSADGHKWLCGPEGAGIGWASERALHIVQSSCKGWLAVKEPFQFELFDQEYAEDGRKYHDGSLNIVGIMALNASVKMLLDAGIENISERVNLLSGYAIDHVKKRDWSLLTPERDSDRAGIVTFKPDSDPTDYFLHLKQHNITCALRGGFLRISPHAFNSYSDLDYAFEIMDGFE